MSDVISTPHPFDTGSDCDSNPVFPDYLWMDDKTSIDGLFPWSIIAEQLPSGLFIIDACTYSIVYHNVFAAQHMRLSHTAKRSQFLFASQILDRNGLHFNALKHPIARALLFGDTLLQQEILFIHEDATRTFLGLNVAPLRSPEGVIVAALCTFDDITARMQEEQRVKQQTDHLIEAMEALQVAQEDLIAMRSSVEMERQRYQELFEFATSGYLVTDLHGIIREANHAAIKCLGITPQYAVGKILVNMVALEDRVRFRILLHQLGNIKQANDFFESNRVEWAGRLIPQHLPPMDVILTVSPFREPNDQLIQLRWLLRDVTDQKRLENARQNDHHHLLEQERKAATLEERNRIAQEFHDTLAQGFTGIAFLLAAAADAITAAPDLAKTQIIRARLVATESIAEARRSISAMRTQTLESGNLPVALALLVEERRQNTPVPIVFHVEGTPFCLPVQIENDLLRIGQESITNAIKHANASRVSVNLLFASQDSHLEILLIVEDDGQGMQTQNQPSSTSSASHGYGLIGMRERARRINASFALESSLGRGTRVKVTVRLPTL